MSEGRPAQTERPATPRHRNRALCCECGELRTVAQGYRGSRPGSDAGEPAGAWCTWLRCGNCRASTRHALIVDYMADTWRRDGCDRERHDRVADRHRRRIGRRLNALAEEGVSIDRASSAEDMSLVGAIVEVVEYADTRDFLIRVRATAEPPLLREAVELAEDLLDTPEELGPWVDDATGIWRGLAILSP